MVTILKLVSHVAVLLVGSTLLSVLYESIQGNTRFSLPFINILLVTLLGGVLSYWYGWFSTGIVLGVYAGLSIVGGLIDGR
jgi:hypothetical protein